MKGLELPINALVVIVIVIVVLLAVIAVFFNVFEPSIEGTSLQSATSATCMRVNPQFCENTDFNRILAARAPVYDFDANNNGILNEHIQEGSLPTRYCYDDNLEMLCYKYYGCQGQPDCSILNLDTEEEWKEWYNCCMKRVCGCP